MSRRAFVPQELCRRPFRLNAAVAAGLITRRQLQGDEWLALYPGVYASRSLNLDYTNRCVAAALFVNRRGVLSGVSAAHFWGADLRPRDSTLVEVTVVRRSGLRPRPGLTIVHSRFLPGDIDLVRGVPVTGAARTAFDLARRAPFVEAVIACDALLHVAPRDRPDLERMVRHRTWRGTAHLPAVLAAIDPRSESPMETRVRLILTGGGVPPPVSQYDVFDEHGRWLARLDLAYPENKVGIEYEGARHRDLTIFQHDLRRLNRLHAAGWRILRYGPGDVFNREHQIVAEVRAALREQ